MMLRGRRSECAVLDGLLDRFRADSGTLVMRGEVGVGKTALLEHAIGQAWDLRIIRAVGVESEMELAFAGLHQLCAPRDGASSGRPLISRASGSCDTRPRNAADPLQFCAMRKQITR